MGHWKGSKLGSSSPRGLFYQVTRQGWSVGKLLRVVAETLWFFQGLKILPHIFIQIPAHSRLTSSWDDTFEPISELARLSRYHPLTPSFIHSLHPPPFIHLHIHPFIHSSIHPLSYTPIHISTYPSIIHLPIHPSLQSQPYTHIYLPIYLSIIHSPIIHPSNHPSIHLLIS